MGQLVGCMSNSKDGYRIKGNAVNSQPLNHVAQVPLGKHTSLDFTDHKAHVLILEHVADRESPSFPLPIRCKSLEVDDFDFLIARLSFELQTAMQVDRSGLCLAQQAIRTLLENAGLLEAPGISGDSAGI